MGLDDFSAVGVLGSDGAVELALRGCVPGETQGEVGLGVPEEVLLLVPEPEVVIVLIDRCPAVRSVRGPICVVHLAHHKEAVQPVRIRVDCHGLQDAVGRAPLGLKGGASIE